MLLAQLAFAEASLAEMFYDDLLRIALGSTLLLAAAALAVLLERQPARRIRVIQLALAGLVALPCLMLVPGYPRLAILPVLSPSSTPSPSLEEGRGEGEAAPATPLQTDVEISPSPTPISQASTVPPPSPSMGEGRGEGEALPITVVLAPRAAALDPPSQQLPPTAIEPERDLPAAAALSNTDYRAVLVAAYATGVVVMALWSLVGMLAVRRLLRSAQPAPPECRILLRAIGGPRSDRVALVTSTRAAQPCALFWQTTTIVLPQSLAAGGDIQALRWALAHEWSHVERGDLTTWTASGIVRWFYFYQPLVWWLRGQLQLSQDYVADAAAARAGEEPEDYAEFLTTSSFTRSTLAAGLGIGGRISDLQRRVVMLVERRRHLETQSPRRWNLLALPIAVLVIAATAGLAPEEKPATADGDKPETKAAPAEVPANGPLDPATPAPAKAAAAPVPPVRTAPAVEPVPSLPPTASAPAPAARAGKPAEATTETTVAPAIEARAAMSGSGQTRVSENDVELELRKDPLITAFGKELVDLKVALAAAKSDSDAGNSAHLERRISTLKELIEEEKAELRPRIVEMLSNKAIQEQGVTYQAATPRYKAAMPKIKSAPAMSPTTVSSTLELPGPYQSPPPKNKPLAPPQSLGSDTLTAPGKISPGDTLDLEAVYGDHGSLVLGDLAIDAEGAIALGAKYGRVKVGGLTVAEAEEKIATALAKVVPEPVKVQISLDARPRAGRPVTYPPNTQLPATPATGPTVSPYLNLLHAPPANQQHDIQPGNWLAIEAEPAEAHVKPLAIVEADGSLALGVSHGRVNVLGKTLSEAEAIVRERLAQTIREPQVQITFADRSAGVTAPLAGTGQGSRVSDLQQQIKQLNATVEQLQRALDKEGKQKTKPAR